MTKRSKFCVAFTAVLLASSLGWAQQRRKVIINQDGSGPGGSNMQTLLVLLQSAEVEVLGLQLHILRKDGGEDLETFGHDFLTDAVTGDHCEIDAARHARYPTPRPMG